jgi:hypothetical protein
MTKGWRDFLLPAIGEAALAHYADFGHCAIYALQRQKR